MNNCNLINQTSCITEFYTPEYIITKVKNVIGEIDLDPASCEFSNQNIIKAKRFFDIKTNGLDEDWKADSLWLNHPFNRKENAKWIKKIIKEYECGNIKEACCITFASTSERWFRGLHDYPQCYFYKRINYLNKNGIEVKGSPKGSVITYFGKKTNKFIQEFSEIGSVKIPI